MTPSNQRASAATLALITLILGLIGGVWLDRSVLTTGTGTLSGVGNTPTASSTTGTSTSSGTLNLDLNLVNQVEDLINQNYVDRGAVQSEPLTYGAISGMVDALGDTGHSRFMSPAEVKAESSLTTGSYEGVGLQVEIKNGSVVVVAPLDNSPAQKAGIRSGDVFVQVDGKSVEGLSLQQVVDMVLGPAGSNVTLTMFRPSTNVTFDVPLVRAKLSLQSVAWSPVPGTTIAHLRIAEFSNGVAADLGKAMQEIQDQHMTGIVLDLRNDPGGLLDEEIAVTGYFLKTGNALLEQDAKGKITDVPLQKQSLSTDLPVTVLINEGTASAAEILAGALQDAKRAPLLGATTFGTGTVLNEFPLSDGSAVLLATQEWLTPSGRVIWHNGVVPDTAISLPTNVSPVLPEEESSMTAAQLQSSGDAQLLKAVETLSK